MEAWSLDFTSMSRTRVCNLRETGYQGRFFVRNIDWLVFVIFFFWLPFFFILSYLFYFIPLWIRVRNGLSTFGVSSAFT